MSLTTAYTIGLIIALLGICVSKVTMFFSRECVIFIDEYNPPWRKIHYFSKLLWLFATASGILLCFLLTFETARQNEVATIDGIIAGILMTIALMWATIPLSLLASTLNGPLSKAFRKFQLLLYR